MQILLIPGMWLDSSSWDEVAPTLRAAGHEVRALTLPGLESPSADRSQITLRDHIDAIVAAIDAATAAAGDAERGVMVVGHSAGAGVVWGAVDARPDRVARAIFVGGFPTGSGRALAAGYAAVNGEIPLPDWSEFDETDLADLDEAALHRFRERAIPTPARVVSDPQRLTDERRYQVPVTVVCPEFTSEMLRGWIENGEESVSEFTRITRIEYVDLPTGHWPQFTRPVELANAIAAAAEG